MYGEEALRFQRTFELPLLKTRDSHPVARCKWCGGEFVRFYRQHFICENKTCADRQIAAALWKLEPPTSADASPFLYVPTPVGVELDESRFKNVLFGGAAGGSKSYGLRWNLYRWCMQIAGYQALLIRNTFPELESTHIKMMRKEEGVLGCASYHAGKHALTFDFNNGSSIRLGHCESEADMNKYLSTEYDHIVIDEATLLKPAPIREISSRARSSNIEVVERGGGWVRMGTNPGGPSHTYLKMLYIDRRPDPRVIQNYHPENYGYIPAKIEDNPYLEADYESARLDNLTPERYQQQRFGNWDIFAGQFFDTWQAERHVVSMEP